MENDIQRMLADLGASRRDVLSAPSADAKGRELHENPSLQTAAREEAEARRRRLAQGVAEGHQQAQLLGTWNDATNFDADAVALSLEDRYGGQGHRAALQQAMRSGVDGGRPSRIEPGAGSRRGNHLSQAATLPSRTHRAPLTSQSEWLSQVRGSTITGGRSNPAAARRRDRAPSPRAHGTIRFPSSRTTVSQVSERPLTQTNPQKANPLSPCNQLLASRYASAPAEQASALRSAQIASINAVAERRELKTARSRVSRPEPATTSARASAASNKPPPSLQAQPSPFTDPHILRQSQMMMARHHAANPGSKCDAYYETHSDELHFLSQARDQLIKEATVLAQDDNEQAVQTYIQTHKDRGWMVELARAAKYIVEHGSAKDLEKFRQSNARHALFLRAALSVFERQNASAERAPDEGSSMSPDDASQRGAYERNGVTTTDPVNAGDSTNGRNGTTTADHRNDASTAKSHVAADSCHGRVNAGGLTNSRNGTTAAEHRNGTSTAKSHVAADSCNGRDVTKLQADDHRNGTDTAENGTAGHREGSNTVRNDQVNGTDITNQRNGMNNPDQHWTMGTWTMTFINSAGKLLGVHQTASALPVDATMTITSRNPRFDPRSLITGFEDLSRAMAERTQATTHVPELKGAFQAIDGLWDEIEDDEEL